jgi:dipeptidase
MKEKIDEEVSVVMYYSSRKRVALPHLLSWRDREYEVGSIGYHHKVYEGKVLHHIFELVDKTNTIWFRLDFNSDSLHWNLEAVSDGNAY